MIKKLRNTFLLVLIVFGLAAGPVLGMGADAVEPPKQSLTILHTNDSHGQFMKQRADWLEVDTPPFVGGIPALATYYRRERRRAHHEDRGLLVLDAGDWFTGTPESDLTDGKAMITGLNQLGIDYTTPGNHEFDVGTETLVNRIRELETPVLSANITTESGTQFPGTRSRAIKEVQGLKVGIFGLIAAPEMRQLVEAGMIEDVSFANTTESARKNVRELRRKKVDLIVALTHQGLEADRELARQVAGIDVIVGGHSHSRVQSPEVIGKTVVVQAGSSLSEVGRLDLEINSRTGGIKSVSGGLVSLSHELYPPDETVKQSLAPYIERVDEKLSEVVGRAAVSAERNSRSSSPLGNLITDAMRTAVEAEIGFQNSYGIRDELPAGKITVRRLYRVLPFGNELVTMDLKGKQLKEIFEQSATLEKGLIQLSGARVKLDFERPPGRRVREVTVGGEPLAEEKTYRVVTNSFLAEGGDGFAPLGAGKDKLTHTGLTIRQALRDYIEAHSPLGAQAKFREKRYILNNKPPRE